jgi:hypothetical protein
VLQTVGARLLVIGLSGRRRVEGIGAMRLSVAETRFTWRLGSQDGASRAGQETGVE